MSSSPATLELLELIAKRPKGIYRPNGPRGGTKEMALELGILQPTLTSRLQRITRDGLVKVDRPFPSSKAVNSYSLTAAGRAEYKRLLAERQRLEATPRPTRSSRTALSEHLTQVGLKMAALEDRCEAAHERVRKAESQLKDCRHQLTAYKTQVRELKATAARTAKALYQLADHIASA